MFRLCGSISLFMVFGFHVSSCHFLMEKYWVVKNKIYLILRYGKNGNDTKCSLLPTCEGVNK